MTDTSGALKNETVTQVREYNTLHPDGHWGVPVSGGEIAYRVVRDVADRVPDARVYVHDVRSDGSATPWTEVER